MYLSPRSCRFAGAAYANLATVGYRLLDLNRQPVGTRITAGVVASGDGRYSAAVSLADDFTGWIVWDTGTAPPVYAEEEIVPRASVDLSPLEAAVAEIAADTQALVEDVADLPTADEIAAALRGAGANPVTLALTNLAYVPLSDVRITIRDAAGVATLAVGATDANGEAHFNLNDGDYQVLVSSTPAYEPFLPQMLTVAGDTAAAYTLTPITVGAPASPSLCRVYGWLRTADGQPSADTPVEFRLTGRYARIADGAVVIVQALTKTTDDEGYFEADLTRSSALTALGEGETPQYYVQATDVGLLHTITVPDQENADIAVLLPDG